MHTRTSSFGATFLFMATTHTYIAFLRGINVGGNKKVPMADLKKLFAKLGYKNAVTYIASGNISFETDSKSPKDLTARIAEALEDTFGFTVDVIVRSLADLRKLYAADPFAGIPVTKETRLYVTFLGDKPKSTLKLPYTSDDKSFRILRATNTEIFSYLDLRFSKTPDAMNILEKEFSKKITTRNWNTIVKIIDTLE